MTTANQITITRILMIPVFVLFALYYGRSVARGAPQEWMRYTAIAVFIVAAGSDCIDGYIARRFNQMSKLGVILDPIADKGLLLAGIITLSVSNWQYEFPLWFPVLVIARDMVIVAGVLGVHFINGDVRVRPSWMGKTATVAQMIAIGCAMLFSTSAWRGRIVGMEVAFLDLPVIVAGFFTLISGLGYVREGIRQMHSKGHGEPNPPGKLLG
jgi:CDP-diacylglycerol--glycerol-3-phosphate 3-phosphatidyltransferase